LFNTRAKTYIVKLIDDFNTSIYILVSLLLINIISKKAMLFGFGKRIIIYIIDTKREIYTLNLRKVQYLPNCSINIFKARKFLGRGDI